MEEHQTNKKTKLGRNPEKFRKKANVYVDLKWSPVG